MHKQARSSSEHGEDAVVMQVEQSLVDQPTANRSAHYTPPFETWQSDHMLLFDILFFFFFPYLNVCKL